MVYQIGPGIIPGTMLLGKQGFFPISTWIDYGLYSIYMVFPSPKDRVTTQSPTVDFDAPKIGRASCRERV